MFKKIILLASLLPSLALGAGKLQNADFATAAAITGAGGTVAQLLNTSKIYDSTNAVLLDTTLAAKLSTALNSGMIIVGSAGNLATAVAMSGDATIVASGALTIANLAITNAKIANSTIDLTTKVTGILPNANTTADAANTASAIVARDGSGNFAAGTITAALSGNASTSSALAANGANCSAGQYPKGVDASGAAESCSAIDLAADVSGINPLANGGTNKNMTPVNGGIVWTDADSQEVSAAGVAGQVLQSTGASAPAFSSTPTLGIAGTTSGKVNLAGSTSGTVTIQPTPAAGTWTLQLPDSPGTSGYVLQTDGGSPAVTSWVAQSGGGGSNTVVASSFALANWPLTINQYGDLASISLTAGTWQITVYAYVYNNGTTNLTTVQTGVTSHSGNSSTDLDQANANFFDQTPWNNTSGNVYMMNTPGVIVSPGSTTTYYLKGYAAGTNTTNLRAGGRITAVKLIP